jgi:hypothetical protein
MNKRLVRVDLGEYTPPEHNIGLKSDWPRESFSHQRQRKQQQKNYK